LKPKFSARSSIGNLQSFGVSEIPQSASSQPTQRQDPPENPPAVQQRDSEPEPPQTSTSSTQQPTSTTAIRHICAPKSCSPESELFQGQGFQKK